MRILVLLFALVLAAEAQAQAVRGQRMADKVKIKRPPMSMKNLAVLLATGAGQAVSAISAERAAASEAMRLVDSTTESTMFVVRDSLTFAHKREKISCESTCNPGVLNGTAIPGS